jgi:hypothetical protein
MVFRIWTKCLFCVLVVTLPRLTRVSDCVTLVFLRSAASGPLYWPSDPTKVKSGKPLHANRSED